MTFKKGEKRAPSAGRKLGSTNKSTECMRKAWTIAFDTLGGAEALAVWADENRTDFYKLASKLIPTQISGDPNNPLQVDLTMKDAAESLKAKFNRIAELKGTQDNK